MLRIVSKALYRIKPDEFLLADGRKRVFGRRRKEGTKA